MTEDEMVGWHHRLKWTCVGGLNGFNGLNEQTPRDSEAQGILACCSPWGRRGLGVIEQQKD